MSDDSGLEDIARELFAVSTKITTLKTLYDRVKRNRMSTFFKGLCAVSDDLSDDERERFRSYVSSAEGIELLTDFADNAMRTRSQTAITALAVLFSNPVDEPYDSEFKAEAAQALEGIFRQLDLCISRALLRPRAACAR